MKVGSDSYHSENHFEVWKNHSEKVRWTKTCEEEADRRSSSTATVSAVTIILTTLSSLNFPYHHGGRFFLIFFFFFLNQRILNTAKRRCENSFCTTSCFKTVLSNCRKKEDARQTVRHSFPSFLRFLHICYRLLDSSNVPNKPVDRSFKVGSAAMLPNYINVSKYLSSGRVMATG